MKKIAIILGSFLVCSVLFFGSLSSYYYHFLGQKYYAKENFETAGNYFGESEFAISHYNLGNSLYKMGKYKQSVDVFESIEKQKNNELSFRSFANLGNSYYKLGEAQNNEEFWKKSIENYEQALSIKDDEQVEKNKEFVEKKLEENKKKQEETQETSQENTQNEQSAQEKNKETSQEGKGEQGKNLENGENQQESGEDGKEKKDGKNQESSEKGEDNGEETASTGKSGESEQDGKTELQKAMERSQTHLSEQEKKYLDNYQQELQNGEAKTSQYFGKVYQEKKSDPFDMMSNFENFFEEDFFQERGGKSTDVKDW